MTARDNVALAPYDIDRDGKLDFALGAELAGHQHHRRWLLPGLQLAAVTNITTEPTIHRIRWADVDGDNRPELIVVPLHGRGTKAPDWTAGPGSRILVFKVPADPAKDQWPVEVADDSLHIVHNFTIVGKELWVASAEGVTALSRAKDGKWTKRHIADGKPGEIKSGRAAGKRRIATVEPWHGQSIVIYDEQSPAWQPAPSSSPTSPRPTPWAGAISTAIRTTSSSSAGAANPGASPSTSSSMAPGPKPPSTMAWPSRTSPSLT